MGLLGLKCMLKSTGDGCKDGLDTDRDGSSISMKWGCAHPISC